MSGDISESDEGEDEVSGEPEEVLQGVRSLSESLKKIVGATYALVFNRPRWQQAVISVVLFIAGQFVSVFLQPIIKRKINSLPALRQLTPDGPVFSADQYILFGLVLLLLYTMYKLNRIESELTSMRSARTDGGRTKQPSQSGDSTEPDDPHSGGSGEGAFVGMLGGAIAGSPGGPAGAITGAVVGAFLGDALEKQSEKSSASDDPGRQTQPGGPADRRR